MRRYIAGVVELLCILACAVTGDFYGCWLLNGERSPVAWVYRWAVMLRWDDHPESHTECPTCHFDRNQYLPRSQWDEDTDRYYEMGYRSGQEEALKALNNPQVLTCGSGASTLTVVWPSRGTPCS